MYKPTGKELEKFWRNPINEKWENQIYERYFSNWISLIYTSNWSWWISNSSISRNFSSINIFTQKDYEDFERIFPKSMKEQFEEQ